MSISFLANVNRTRLRAAIGHLERGDWQAAHAIVQEDEESALSCWAHGIVHILEGDLPNARYWYRLAKREFPESPNVDAEVRALAQATG